MANKQDYLDRLDHINGSSFDFIKNLNNMVISGGFYEFPIGTDLSVISWYSGRAENSELQTWQWGWSVFPDSNAYLKSSKDNTADNIYITSSGNQYSVEINCPIIAANMDYLILIPGYNGNTDGHRRNAGFFKSNGQWLTGGGVHGDPVAHWNTLNKTGTLDEIFTFLEHWCKNINIYVDGEFWDGPVPPPIVSITSNGGGATHIAKVTGQLKDLSSNLSDILMVSGGGGGGLLVGETEYTGKEAGGISGNGDNSANQSTGNAFGQGESGTNVSGGGSGLYGGYKGTSAKSGGAGSGYIGNSLLSNKKMVGYNVPTSSAEATKTESVNEVSASAVSGKPKSGNGFARIKFLSEPQNVSLIIESNNSYILNPVLVKSDTDINNNYEITSDGGYTAINNNLSQYIGTNKTLHSSMRNAAGYFYTQMDNIIGRHGTPQDNMRTQIFIPTKELNVIGVKFKHTSYANYGSYNSGFLGLYKIVSGLLQEVGTKTVLSTTVGEWKDEEWSLQNISSVDYISILWADGTHDFKDIILVIN